MLYSNRRSLVLVTALSISLAGCSSGKQEPAVAAENGASVAESNAAEESDSNVSTIRISNATPASANGEFHLGAVDHVPSLGGASTFQAVGRSGPMEHSVILTFNGAGGLDTVMWTRGSDDGSVKVWVSCDTGKQTQAPCAEGHFKADAKTGAVSFEGLALKGLDQNGEVASATISGNVR